LFGLIKIISIRLLRATRNDDWQCDNYKKNRPQPIFLSNSYSISSHMPAGNFSAEKLMRGWQTSAKSEGIF